ncbi:MAG: hypothetical protein KDK48_05815, partial [Chlamydiia bacterium]|nr:hypothetical protein [Chlamydiia bacterium]
FQFAYGSISFPTPSFDPATASRAALEKILKEQYEYKQSDIDDIVDAAVEPIDAQIAVLQGQIAATNDQNVINALQAQINALEAQKPEAIRQALVNTVYAEQRNDLLRAGYPPSLVDGTYPKMRVDELGQPIRDGFGELIFDAAPTLNLALAIRDFRRGIIAALSTLQLAMKGVTGFLDKIDLEEFIDLFRSLFSRGAVTVETLESASASAGTTGSAPTAGFASFVASLSNPNLQGILGQSLASSAALLQYLNVALKDGTVTPVTTNLIAGLVTALIGPSVVAEALKNPEIREFILNSTDADSSGESLAALVATVQAIVKLVQEGRFKDDITALLENTPPFSSLPEGERQAFLETVGNLVNYSILYAAGQDLAAAVDSPAAVLAQSQVELALGQLGGAPELNEVLQDALEASNQEALQYELTDAFTDVLVNGGISGDASKALAIRFSTGLFAADDPAAFLREALGNAGVEGSLANEVGLAALLALLFPTNAPDDLGVRIARRFSDDVAAEAERASRERVVEQTREILQGKNFDAPLIDQVLGLVGRDRSFAAQVASLSTLVDPKTVSQIIGTLRDAKLTTTLSVRLAGELGDGAAGALASYALNSINSIENILRNTLNESLGSGESGQERGSKRLAKELFKEKIGPNNLENYTKLYIAAIDSIWGEGLIPQNVNMRTDIDRPGISIAA